MLVGLFATLVFPATAAVTDDADRLIVPAGETHVLGGSRAYRVSIEIEGTLLVSSYVPSATTGSLELSAPDVLIGPMGRVSADAAGYGPATGPGAGVNESHNSGGGRGSGAGYGGYGGIASQAGGVPYGSLSQPSELGSGGGGVTNSGILVVTGGRGGGRIKISAGTLRVDGRISADGGTGPGPNYWGDRGGGGSGGAVLITAQQLEGTGVISANGGASSPAGNGSGGGGGGGRVAVSFGTSVFAGSVTARGGAGYQYGGAGTVVYGPELRIENGITGASTTILSGTYSFERVIVSSNAIVDVSSAASLGAVSLLTQGNSTFTNRGSLTVTGAATAAGGGVLRQAGGTLSAPRLEVLGGIFAYDGGTLSAAEAEAATGGVLSVNTRLELARLLVRSGGAVTHEPGDADFDLAVSQTLTIEPGGRISADGRGFRPTEGPGAGGSHDDKGGGGGGYGGQGGQSGSNIAGGLPYGSLAQPMELGSGGGNLTGPFGQVKKFGGRGGGRLNISAGTLRVEGRISADGGGGDDPSYWGGRAGGGSGGAVLITAQQLEGTGVISANGGVSSRGAADGGNGGGGGGGRVAVSFGTSVFAGSVTARGGAGYQYGGAGTVVYGPELRIENGITGATTTILSGTYSFERVIVSSNAVVEVSSAVSLGAASLLTQGRSTFTNRGSLTVTGTAGAADFGVVRLLAGALSALRLEALGGGVLIYEGGALSASEAEAASGGALIVNARLELARLLVASGGVVTHEPGDADFDLAVSQTLTVESGGRISGDAAGYAPMSGPGKGESRAFGGGGHAGGGGGYGGQGGIGSSGLGGLPYGSLAQPQDLGSGGGSLLDNSGNVAARGGWGGGRLKISAGTLRVDGRISADGQTAPRTDYWGDNAGGGSGGSILIAAQQLVGAGEISANGGASSPRGQYNGGGGGGGRIAISYGSSVFVGTIAARGGAGFQYGGAGTVVYGPELRIENGITGASTTITSGAYAFDRVVLGGHAVVEFQPGVLLNVADSLTVRDCDFELKTGTLSASQVVLLPGGGFTYSAGVLNASSVDIAQAAVMSLNQRLQLSWIRVRSGGLLTHAPGRVGFDLAVTGDATIEVGGSVSADASGYGPEEGPGKGARVVGQGSNAPGAGHAAFGGSSQYGTGGGVYGSLTQPSDPGSGGGNAALSATSIAARGGRGGGRLRLQVGGTLRVDGRISVNGANAVYESYYGMESGGGSGGSILIDASRLEGAGTISADGGHALRLRGGGGAGGRVAVYYGQKSGVIAFSARPGLGYRAGGPGTLLDNGVLVNFTAPGSSAPVAMSQMSQSLGAQSVLFETLLLRPIVFSSLNSSGTVRGTFSGSELTLVTIKTGSFAGSGFFRGRWSASLDGAPLSGEWEGIALTSSTPDVVFLKGVLKGGIRSTFEGQLSASAAGSGVLDQFTASGRVIQVGDKVGAGDWFLSGAPSVSATSEAPGTALDLVQTSLTGSVSGHYAGPLETTLTLLRVNDAASPYHGEGFMRLTYTSTLGDGEGWTYVATPGGQAVRLHGLLAQPLRGLAEGIVSLQDPRSLLLSIERLDIGLPFQPELSIRVFGSRDVSPGEVVTYSVELRNDGYQSADSVSIIAAFPDSMDFAAASDDYAQYNVSHWIGTAFAPKPFVRWDLPMAPPKSTIKRYIHARVRLPSAPGFPAGRARLGGTAFLVPTARADQMFAIYERGAGQ